MADQLFQIITFIRLFILLTSNIHIFIGLIGMAKTPKILYNDLQFNDETFRRDVEEHLS